MTTDRASRRFPEGAVLDAERCLICASESLDTGSVVFRDELWAAEVTPGYEVPGWFFLRARRHALGWPELDERELATFGNRMQRLVEAITVATDAPTTYLFNFGESFAHFHCLVAARTDQVPADRRTGQLLRLGAEAQDPEEARTVAAAVRRAYAESEPR